MSSSNFRQNTMQSVSALSQVLGDVEHDFNDFKEELFYLRSIVYPTVHVLSPKTSGTYAEVLFTVPRHYIRSHGLFPLVEMFLKDIEKICNKNAVYMVPSIKKNHDDDEVQTLRKSYVVTFLVITSNKIDFIQGCQHFSNKEHIEKVILYVNDLMYSLSTFDNYSKEFERDIIEFLDLEEPIYFELKDGYITQHTGKMSTKLVV